MNFPTQLTMLRIILTPVFLYFLFVDRLIYKYISFIVFTIASLTDLYDGYYAKKYGYVTKWGKFLDPLADKILVSSALIAFYYLGYIKLWIVLVIIIRDFLITGLRSYALYKEQPVATKELARTKTFMQMASVFIIFLFLLIDYQTASIEKQHPIIHFLKEIGFTNILMAVVAILTLYTGILYLVENRNQIRNLIFNIYKIFVPSE